MTPDKVQARKMVLIGVLLLALTSIYRERRDPDGHDTFRVLWGVGVVGMFLSLLADFVPQIAGPFAILIVLGSLTSGGDKALKTFLGAIVPQPPSSPSQPVRSASGSTTAPAH